MSKLSDAFKEMCAVSRVRPDLAAGSIEDAARRLWKVLGEYSEAVGLAALDIWPRRSEWFPAEKELRGLLDEIASNAAREAQARGAVGGGKYRQPVGNTVAFVEEVRKRRGGAYCQSWLAGGITCLFSANIIYTTGIGRDRLQRDVGALAEDMGVQIVRDRECSEMLARYCADNSLSSEPRPRRRA